MLGRRKGRDIYPAVAAENILLLNASKGGIRFLAERGNDRGEKYDRQGENVIHKAKGKRVCWLQNTRNLEAAAIFYVVHYGMRAKCSACYPFSFVSPQSYEAIDKRRHHDDGRP